VAGRRPSEEIERLAGHLEECHRCAATVDSLLADDTLVRNLAVRSAGLPAEEAPLVANLIRRLSELALLPAAVAETLAEATTSKVPRPEVAQEHYDFLSPAEGPGELGRLGGYRVLWVLGAGGMGVVFEAEDPQLKRRVALKVMKPALAASDSARQRFLREAQATAALEHDHIVSIYQVGQDRGVPFLAMPLLKGETLEDRLHHLVSAGCEPPVDSEPGRAKQGADAPRSPRQLALSETLRIGREMASGLAAAHQRGLVHRDVKPANVWLEGTRGRVKLLDFGLARAQAGADGADAAQLTQEGGILGTPAYMSPEQAKGQPIDARSDLFSLGCVLYRLATGQPAFKGADAVSTLLAITTAKPKPPREHNRELPASLSDLIMALLAKNRDERPASAQAVVEAIEAIEVENREQGTGNRGGRLRTWAIAAAAAALLLAGIVVIVRDRSGNEIGRIQVPPGGNAETRESDDTKPSGGQSQETGQGRQATLEKISPPIDLPEPPPLEEWLKDRTVLTVAQDGSGQFKTIQAALDALRPGEAVEVLDRGPYRESLFYKGLRDTGLVSRQGAAIRMPTSFNHILATTVGFRLSGFEFFPAETGYEEWMTLLSLHHPSGLVIENCFFHAMPTEPSNLFAIGSMFGKEEGEEPVVIRDNIIEGQVRFSSDYARFEPRFVFERNWMRPKNYPGSALQIVGIAGSYVIRQNVFERAAAPAMLLHFQPNHRDPRRMEQVEKHPKGIRVSIDNNTLADSGITVISWWKEIAAHIEAHNNLFGGPLFFEKFAYDRLPSAEKAWDLGNNFYLRPPKELDELRLRPSDLSGDPRFASREETNPDLLRPLVESPLATAGAGGAWPSYVGALPPGPAPKDGDWFSRMRERWRLEGGEPAVGTRNSENATAAAIPPPIEVPEPPPLEEWLKDRTVLTVAQDGSGQFKTIQSALDALQAGEVVSVLDRGPYRERLVLDAVPRDTGLISEKGTVIELSEWKFAWKEGLGDMHLGHVFSNTDGFRLHGFEMVFPKAIKLGRRLEAHHTGGLVVEHCHFRALPSDTWDGPPLMFGNHYNKGAGLSVWVRHCLIEGYLDIEGRAQDGVTVVIEQNLFLSGPISHHLYFHGDAWNQAVVRRNIFVGKAVCDLVVNEGWKPSSALEVANNTSLTDGDLVIFLTTSLRGAVDIRNNLRTSPQLVSVIRGAEKDIVAGKKAWRVDHNAYPDVSNAQPTEANENLVPRSPVDIPTSPHFLSKNPTDADYLRIATDSPPATAGAGGDWPNYIGALPPGPAPADGDWFTWLRQRWTGTELKTATAQVNDVSPPIEVPEPPPLDEWLKGRTVLTVAQDGSGQFKTIQSALDALQAGQAVEVLDRGPYREALQLVKPPQDVGLFSRHQTVIELDEWKREPMIQSVYLQGHCFLHVQGFRLSGFRLTYHKKEDGQGATYWLWPIGLLIEDCAAYSEPSLDNHVTLAVCATLNGAAAGKPMVVRDCVFIAGGVQPAGQEPGSAVFLRNYFYDSGIHTVSRFDELVIRNNVFVENRTANPFLINDMIALPRVLEIANNTLFGGQPGVFSVRAPQQGVIFRNNILRAGIDFWYVPDEERDQALQGWKFDHNGLPRGKSELRSATDVLGEPDVLSADPESRDYLRIATDSPLATAGAGGDWPGYIGALPPGPAPAEGDWFTRLRQRWNGTELKTATAQVTDVSPPLQVPEPPQLDEWLKGRTVLTVAQDGSGQFKTIQSALDALQPGQVINVLDAGPYRERLVLEGVPRDTGLISERGTVIELTEWKFARKAGNEEPGDLYLGHVLSGTDGFRLHGFEMVFPEEIKWGYRLHLRRTGGLVIEDCQFRDLSTWSWDGHALKLENQEEDEGPPLSIWVRHCLIEGYVDIAAEGRAEVTVVVERNFFTSGRANHHLRFYGEAWDQVFVRHNIFRGRADHDLMVDGVWKPSSVLEVTNNTTTTSIDLVVFAGMAERGSVLVRNNLRTASRMLAVLSGAENDLAAAQSHWRVDHNAYPDLSPAEPWREENQVPRSPTDVPMTPQFLSKDPANPDYLRISADSPLATAGAGGDWPNYVGALPPGPPPKDGDWFSRLREQWRSAEQKTAAGRVTDMPAPADMPEPPPLEEWLKDREVLTVAQDGSGRFKTIQAALDALQPGQVIKVLDAGPYRERLEMEDVPADTGLVSEKMTVLELPAYQFHYKDADHEYYKGHYFRDMDGFRIAGFTFSFPAREKGPSFGLQTHRGGGFVLERCWLRSPVEAIVGYHAGGSTRLSCVRECRIDGMLHVGSLENDRAATLIARNLFFGEKGVAHVGLDSVYKYLGIRNNVFANPDKGLGLVPSRLGRLEINNNTFLGRNPVFFARSVPSGEVVICNNLRLRAGLLALVGGAEEQRDEVVRDWHVGFNCYPRELAPDDWPGWPKEQLVPRFPNDILATPRFVSKVAGEPDYLRPAADDPIARDGAGGAWPDFIGALPPGPAPAEGDWFTRLQHRWNESMGEPRAD